ncbi:MULTISPECIES: TnsA endonuclease N-terminal domain-containing protein [Bacillus cereus group]|uniref:TnsA endonuclease N-terminal domain-containing protein n=1 Tax=Bacillus cereus group TaxID=86661 RepID=UPI000A304053|nr:MULTISPECIES: TnsA endonuclease N-terminal domain-containing protein [Bacillus cereus group]MDA2136740.1 TnsA endonuclease N-terminal domain-containing protein [Bacillus cereus group sp. Bc256]NUJ08116.1 hypothetical protein [Bacillus paranthracis]SMD80387.1 hypothetical protein BACERE00195_01217 [Bacillus cereus]
MGNSRKVMPSKGKNFRGKIFSQRLGKSIFYESLLERDFIKLLEFDCNVVFYESQPLCIQYRYEGRAYRYFPDFKVITRDLHTYLYEIKPKERIKDSDNLVKFEVGKMYCEQQGWIYSIMTEDDIRKGYLIENLDKLMVIKEAQTNNSIMKYVSDYMEKHKNTCTIKELRPMLSEFSEAEIIGNVYFMICKNLIKVDLTSEVINESSILRL